MIKLTENNIKIWKFANFVLETAKVIYNCSIQYTVKDR